MGAAGAQQRKADVLADLPGLTTLIDGKGGDQGAESLTSRGAAQAFPISQLEHLGLRVHLHLAPSVEKSDADNRMLQQR